MPVSLVCSHTPGFGALHSLPFRRGVFNARFGAKRGQAPPPRLRAKLARCEASSLSCTFFGANTFTVSSAKASILVDPWLTGELSFGPDALYTGAREHAASVEHVMPLVNAVVLTQGLPDHAHPPTLRAIAAQRSTLPVVCSPAAEGPAKGAGLENVTALEPGETLRLRLGNDDACELEATEGAQVGPPWSRRENGYKARFESSGRSIYFEPHGDFRQASLATIAPCDAALMPAKEVFLGRLPLVLGTARLREVCDLLKPSKVVALENGEGIRSQGALSLALSSRGSLQGFRRAVEECCGKGAEPILPAPLGSATTIVE